jgi:DNA mismatch repair protein MutL
LIIHQQRAHERILYEYYIKAQHQEGHSQQLLFPITIELSPSDILLVKEISDELFNLGFRFDYLNNSSIVILGTPTDVNMEQLNTLFEGFMEQYKNQSSLDKENKFALSMAKSMSIKTGRNLHEDEMLSIIDNLFACQSPNTTINGKPTLITITFEELAKKF